MFGSCCSFLKNPVAYFSAEFALHESLPIYSGGLGVLAGDHAKSASDLGVPFVGISLFYRQGYFQQFIAPHGWQEETILFWIEVNSFGPRLRRGWKSPVDSLRGDFSQPSQVPGLALECWLFRDLLA